MRVTRLGEFGLIQRLQQRVPVAGNVIRGIGDDTAVLPYGKGKYLLFTTDLLVEGVDFLRRMPAAAIGHKAMACNISDIAAMGGIPTFAVVSIGLPRTTDVAWVDKMYDGIAGVAKQFGVSIVGGDTSRADKLIINVALLGEAAKTHLVTRDGAKPGDWIFVTGPLGGSFKSGRHLSFTPRTAQAQFLVRHFKPSAMIDISDGLAGDLNHLLKAGGVGAQLREDLVPRHKDVNFRQALTDGEDFELLFTLPSAKAKRLMEYQARHKAFYFYPIGEITGNKKQIIHAKGFTHF